MEDETEKKNRVKAKWTPEEDKSLQLEIDNHYSNKTIAENHQRSELAIYFRILKLASDKMTYEGKSPDNIALEYGLEKSELENFVKSKETGRRFYSKLKFDSDPGLGLKVKSKGKDKEKDKDKDTISEKINDLTSVVSNLQNEIFKLRQEILELRKSKH